MIPKSIGSGDLFYALALSAVFAGIFLLVSALFRLVITPWRRRREVAKRVQDERLTQMARSGIFRSEFEDPKNIYPQDHRKSFRPGTPPQSSANSLSGRYLHRSAPFHQYRHNLRLCRDYAGLVSPQPVLAAGLGSRGRLPALSLSALSQSAQSQAHRTADARCHGTAGPVPPGRPHPAVGGGFGRPGNWIIPWGRNCGWPTKSSAWG